MYLNVDEYNKFEKSGTSELGNRFLEAFHAVAFEERGYPCKVSDNKELFKYIDVMHELRTERYYKNVLYGITKEEFEVLKKITNFTLELSKKNFGKDIFPKAPVLSSLNMFRQIKHLASGENARPTIFEIGSGSGYLGAMLKLDGFTYIGTDVAQAFYLYQNMLWNHILDGKLIELADSKLEIPKNVKCNDMIHVPWWRLLEFKEQKLDIDIVIANHCLCELHENALLYYLNLSKLLMEKSNYKLLVFEGPGAYHVNDYKNLIKILYKAGYVMIHSEAVITIFTLKGNEKTVPVNDSDLLEAYKQNYITHIDNFDDPIAKKIKSGKDIMRNSKKIAYEDFMDFYNEKSNENYSLDEEFLNFLGYKSY